MIKKILRKISIRTQIVAILLFEAILMILGFTIYFYAIKDSSFHERLPFFSIILYWIVVLLIALGFSSLWLEKITDPYAYLNNIITNILDVNFETLKNEALNSDTLKTSERLLLLQKTLQQDINELKEKNSTVTRLINQQSADFKQKKQMISALCHDLKTPLAIIHTTLFAIKDGIIPKNQIEQEIENIILEIERTSKMLQEIVNVYRYDNDLKERNVEKINVFDSINLVCDNLNKLFLKYNQSLKINQQKNVVIETDREQFERLLYNLITNAIIHSPQNNDVIIDLFENGLEIINTGVTIDEKEIENIFKPFYKIDSSRNKKADTGNGLGLYIVKEICDVNNFKINASSSNNQTKFSIKF